jgi:hypothetical protein
MWQICATFGADLAHIDAKLGAYGTRECVDFRRKIFSKHPDIALSLGHDYLRVAQEQTYVEANRRLLSLSNLLFIGELNLSDAPSKLRSYSRHLSNRCLKLSVNLEPEAAWQRCKKILEEHSIDSPSLDEGFVPALNKLADNKWWLKKIQKLQKQRIESIRRDLGQVQSMRSSYCSDSALYKRQWDKAESRKYLESHIAIDEEGNEQSLWEISEHTVSNPAIRRAELMVRIRGFEEVASTCGHGGEFYTMTTPSRMHSHRKNGKRNPKFDGTTPKEAHEYLCHVWRLIRAELNRREIRPYGFRVVEPHHDGTPHWHLLLFVPPEQAEEMASIIRYYTLREDRDEKGADKQRFKRVKIDPDKGTASGYIAKYISKNIDGAYLDKDLYGQDAAISASKIEAWARTFDIRQFQQIGGPSVTVWRELRRLRNDEGDAIEEARRAADSSDWASFCLMMCSDQMRVNSRPIRPVYETPTEVDLETGELIPRKTIHGYRSKPKLVGLQSGTTEICTRNKRFKIESRRAQPPP